MEVTIRPLELADAGVSYKWRNDPEVFKFTGNTYHAPITLEMERAWIERVIGNPADYRCAILVDGEYVGNIYLTNIRGGEADYHIFIGNRAYWGKGIAKRASELILHEGFSKLGLKKINLRVRPQNEAACGLYARLGFRESHRDAEFITMTLTNSSPTL